jgi:hypothetical protein
MEDLPSLGQTSNMKLHQLSVRDIAKIVTDQRHQRQCKETASRFDLDKAMNAITNTSSISVKAKQVVKSMTKKGKLYKELYSDESFMPETVGYLLRTAPFKALTLPNCTLELELFRQSQDIPTRKQLMVGDIEFSEHSKDTSQSFGILKSLVDGLWLINTQSFERIRGLLSCDVWSILRLLDVSGNIGKKEISFLSQQTPYLVILTISTSEILDLSFFRQWKLLIALSVHAPVREIAAHSGTGEKVDPNREIIQLVLSDCSQWKSCNSLEWYNNLSYLKICSNQNLTPQWLVAALQANAGTLTKLDLGSTAAPTDQLLEVLRNANICLRLLSVSYPTQEGGGAGIGGFSNDGLKAYLEWPANTNLETLNIVGHRQLTSELLTCQPVCLSVLTCLDARETNMVQEKAEAQETLLKNIYKFAILAISVSTSDGADENLPLFLNFSYCKGLELIVGQYQKVKEGMSIPKIKKAVILTFSAQSSSKNESKEQEPEGAGSASSTSGASSAKSSLSGTGGQSSKGPSSGDSSLTGTDSLLESRTDSGHASAQSAIPNVGEDSESHRQLIRAALDFALEHGADRSKSVSDSLVSSQRLNAAMANVDEASNPQASNASADEQICGTVITVRLYYTDRN